MPAYLILDVTVNDAERYAEYRKLTPAAIAPFGGKFVVRGGATDSLEGGWEPQRIVVIEFPNMDQARAFWNSPDYAPAKALRQSCSTARTILVEGC